MIRNLISVVIFLLYCSSFYAQNYKLPVNKYSGLTLKEKKENWKSKSRKIGISINANYKVFEFADGFAVPEYKALFGNSIGLRFRFQPVFLDFDGGIYYFDDKFKPITTMIPVIEATASCILLPLSTPTFQPYLGLGCHWSRDQIGGIVWCGGLNINLNQKCYLDFKYTQFLNGQINKYNIQKATLGLGFRDSSGGGVLLSLLIFGTLIRIMAS